MTEVRTWYGATALEAFLVPLDELEPFPGNPRRGDVVAVASSLERFGQVRAIVTDGQRIVAGHHVVQAARGLGWTHVAAITNEFTDEEEARAYLVADNRISDRGGYDDELLLAQLRDVELQGTGYDQGDVEALDQKLRAALEAPTTFPSLDPADIQTDYQCPSCHYRWAGHPRPGVAKE